MPNDLPTSSDDDFPKNEEVNNVNIQIILYTIKSNFEPVFPGVKETSEPQYWQPQGR